MSSLRQEPPKISNSFVAVDSHKKSTMSDFKGRSQEQDLLVWREPASSCSISPKGIWSLERMRGREKRSIMSSRLSYCRKDGYQSADWTKTPVASCSSLKMEQWLTGSLSQADAKKRMRLRSGEEFQTMTYPGCYREFPPPSEH